MKSQNVHLFLGLFVIKIKAGALACWVITVELDTRPWTKDLIQYLALVSPQSRVQDKSISYIQGSR